jgi:group I intron endonuclease
MKGVYKITNTENNKIYIGSSKRLTYRIKQHKSNYKHGRGENKNLQSEYTDGKFTFDIIELCDNYKEREQFYIDTLKPEYNIYPNSKSPLGHKLSGETKRKIGDANKSSYKFSKVSESEVDEIRRLYQTGNYTQNEIAMMFSLNQGYVSHLVRKNRRK